MKYVFCVGLLSLLSTIISCSHKKVSELPVRSVNECLGQPECSNSIVFIEPSRFLASQEIQSHLENKKLKTTGGSVLDGLAGILWALGVPQVEEEIKNNKSSLYVIRWDGQSPRFFKKLYEHLDKDQKINFENLALSITFIDPDESGYTSESQFVCYDSQCKKPYFVFKDFSDAKKLNSLNLYRIMQKRPVLKGGPKCRIAHGPFKDLPISQKSWLSFVDRLHVLSPNVLRAFLENTHFQEADQKLKRDIAQVVKKNSRAIPERVIDKWLELFQKRIENVRSANCQ